MSSPSEVSPPTHSFSVVRVLLVAVPLGILCGWLMKSYWPQRIEAETSRSGEEKLQKLILGSSTNNKLDARFADADGDLVADCPKDVAQQISPATLVFAYIAGPNAEKERADWQPFADFLAKKTSKRVEVVSFSTISEELDALKNGKLHIAGFNTGAVTAAVNHCGFVPVCSPGKADGSFGIKMQIIVPAKSEIRTLDDLKGHTITFTDRSSNSGYKAALVKLEDVNLLPERDYSWRFSGGHDESIAKVAMSECEAAPVASDLLQRAVTNGAVSMGDIRVIKESESFPPAALGYAYNLSPELAAEIKAALLQFSWSGTGLEKQFPDANRFVPISYKTDFELIRRIDDSVKSAPDASSIAEPPSSHEAPSDEEAARKAG
jgi:phosphonate transport system substrate-binding protein